MLELMVKNLEVGSNSTAEVIYLKGYANKFIDDNGELIIDRSQESVLPAGYDLKSFMKNPILLNGHDKSQPVGKIVNVDIRADGLYIEAELHKAMSEKVFYAVEHEILKAFSIGFIPKSVKEYEDVYLWDAVELFEVSIVAAPDNQESLFSVLTESPCGSGICLLGSKAINMDKARIKNIKLSDKQWSDINKVELKKSLDEVQDYGIVAEAFLLARDEHKKSTWKFPHHELKEGKLVLSKGGVLSAYAALKGAKDEVALSSLEKLEAAKHLEKHFQELVDVKQLDQIPEDLSELIKSFDDIHKGELDVLKDEVEQTKDNGTIKEEETKNGEGSGEQEAKKPAEGTEQNKPASTDDELVGVDAVKAFIETAKDTTDGLNDLLELYMTIEEVINTALNEQE